MCLDYYLLELLFQELREQHRYTKERSGISEPVTTGEAVIIYDESQPRGLWRLGRVERLFNSTDGEVRSASVKVISKNGRSITLKRPIQQFYPLEVRRCFRETGSPIPVEPLQDQEEDQREDQRPPRQAAQRAKESMRRLKEQELI